LLSKNFRATHPEVCAHFNNKALPMMVINYNSKEFIGDVRIGHFPVFGEFTDSPTIKFELLRELTISNIFFFDACPFAFGPTAASSGSNLRDQLPAPLRPKFEDACVWWTTECLKLCGT
jgi:hypothetical protein